MLIAVLGMYSEPGPEEVWAGAGRLGGQGQGLPRQQHLRHCQQKYQASKFASLIEIKWISYREKLMLKLMCNTSYT